MLFDTPAHTDTSRIFSIPRQLMQLVEMLFFFGKAQALTRVPGHSLRIQKLQTLLLGLKFNLYRLKHRCLFLERQLSYVIPSQSPQIQRYGWES